MTDKLQEYRDEIVEINDEILKLLSKRGNWHNKSVRRNVNKVQWFMIHNVKRND